MRLVYEQFSGYKFEEPLPKQGKGRVKAIHYIQSFDPKDNISPELAHKIGRTFARKAFGDNCQVVIATHIDRQHVHNHILMNTYGIDGHKFNANKKTLDELKEISDGVCLAFGIQPFDKSKGKRKTIAYNEWQNERHGASWKGKIRADIDGLVGCVKNVDELLAELEHLGYIVRRGKYISVKAPEQQRAVRLKTLGEDYTIEQLASRILWRDVGAGIKFPCEKSELQDKYSETIRDVQGVCSTQPTLEQLGILLTVINRDRLQSIGEVEGKIKTIKFELEKSRQEVNTMETKCNFLKSLAEQAEKYFALMEQPTLTSGEQLCAEMYRVSLAQQNIQTEDDYEYLKDVISETENKTAPLREHYSKCAILLKEYSDISATYNDISQGDYIRKMIEQQRKQDAPQTRPRR